MRQLGNYYRVIEPFYLRFFIMALIYFVLRPKRGESLDRTEYVLAMSSCVFRLVGRPCQRKLWKGLRDTGPFLRLETMRGKLKRSVPATREPPSLSEEVAFEKCFE